MFCLWLDGRIFNGVQDRKKEEKSLWYMCPRVCDISLYVPKSLWYMCPQPVSSQSLGQNGPELEQKCWSSAKSGWSVYSVVILCAAYMLENNSCVNKPSLPYILLWVWLVRFKGLVICNFLTWLSVNTVLRSCFGNSWKSFNSSHQGWGNSLQSTALSH